MALVNFIYVFYSYVLLDIKVRWTSSKSHLVKLIENYVVRNFYLF